MSLAICMGVRSYRWPHQRDLPLLLPSRALTQLVERREVRSVVVVEADKNERGM